MGLFGLRILDFIGTDYQPCFVNEGKRLIIFVETDGCGLDGIAVATDCSVGRRTLRLYDFGKMAVTMVNRDSNRAIRITPHANSRQLATQYAPDAESRWHAYRDAYQLIPDEEMLCYEDVQLQQSMANILSQPDLRAICALCGEEVMNGREVVLKDGRILCQPCAGNSYFNRNK